MPAECTMLTDGGALIVVGRRHRSKWYSVTCFGRKRHYRKDGSCKHTDAVLEMLKPELRERTRINGWGGG